MGDNLTMIIIVALIVLGLGIMCKFAFQDDGKTKKK